MKTNIYIDAGNLYFGLLKGHPEVKWLDLAAFSRSLLRDDHEINAVKYFTSYIKTFPHDSAAIERQNVYLQALSAVGGIEIILGYYNKNKTYLPALDAQCLDCDMTGPKNLIHVMKFEEKRTDINIATEMLRDAYTTDVNFPMRYPPERVDARFTVLAPGRCRVNLFDRGSCKTLRCRASEQLNRLMHAHHVDSFKS